MEVLSKAADAKDSEDLRVTMQSEKMIETGRAVVWEKKVPHNQQIFIQINYFYYLIILS